MEAKSLAIQELTETASALMADGKGILAMDESTPTCNKRFAAIGIPQTEEKRRDYREMIITTPGLNEGISGVILYDETARQHLSDGTSFIQAVTSAGIIPGIKVDRGAKDMAGFPGEKITEGLDGLRERLDEYYRMGLRFAKWRAVISIGYNTPGETCIESNAEALARYAALCQEVGLVPIFEPEVLMEGDHSIQDCFRVTEKVLHTVFSHLFAHKVQPEGMILKPGMVLPGLDCPAQMAIEDIGEATVECLLRTVPAAVPGIAFLSGGQHADLASARLSYMNREFGSKLPWALSFSYARAIQQPALKIWEGENANVKTAQQALYHRVKCNQAARLGKYDVSMEMI